MTEDQNSRYEFLLHIDDFGDASEVMDSAEVNDLAATNGRVSKPEESKEEEIELLLGI